MTNEEITNGFINLYNFLGAAIEKNNGIKPEKKFEIDKPGVYETRDGRKAFIFDKRKSSEVEYWRGYFNGDMENWSLNGHYGGRLSDDYNLVKFISSTWNFEKGEPV